jgi:Helicase associated domain
MLDQLGFDSSMPQKPTQHDEAWMAKYNRLKEFKSKFGHTRVPKAFGDLRNNDPRLQWSIDLGTWVARQRRMHKANALISWRQSLLDEIDFLWEARTDEHQWDQWFQKMAAYKEKHGHFPATKGNYSAFKGWIQTQRRYEREGKTMPKRKALLNSIGFWGEDNHKFSAEHDSCDDESNQLKSHSDEEENENGVRGAISHTSKGFQNEQFFPVGARFFKKRQDGFVEGEIASYDGSDYLVFYKELNGYAEFLTELDLEEAHFIVPENPIVHIDDDEHDLDMKTTAAECTDHPDHDLDRKMPAL